MGSGSYVIERRTKASAEQVWTLLGDATTWSSWTRMGSSSYESEGDPAPHGVGAVRLFVTGPIKSRERVVVHDPPRHLAYELVSGLPVRGYRADVHLLDDGDGTLIRWEGSWTGTAPLLGPVMAAFLRKAVSDIATALATRSAAASGEPA